MPLPPPDGTRLTLQQRQGAYKRGSIRRVRLQNFLTYADVEFFPGPRLNVVIGPNGTGKSTILCAICLGLGGQPSLLGRADDARTFIMHEKERALIEVELAPETPDDDPDIIKRIIDRNKGSERGRGVAASTYYINGTKSTLKNVRELVEKYNIAVDNLCTFLPQDRVGSFSGFTGTDLLIETEKAIGLETMYEPHMELQRLELEVSNESSEKESIEDRLETAKQEFKSLEREKELMEERKQAEEKIHLLRQKQVWLQFDQARENAVKIKDDRDVSKKELQEARKVLRPLEQKAEHLNVEVEKIQTRTSSLEKTEKKTKDSYDKAFKKISNFDDHLEEQTSNLNSLDTHRRQSMKAVETCRLKLQELVESLKTGYPSMEEAQEHLKSANSDLREVKRRHERAKRDYYAFETKYNDIANQIHTDQSKLEKMKDEKMRRQERLFRQFPRLGKAYDFVDQNRKMFRRPIWGPIAGEILMKSSSLAAFLESMVPSSTLKSFVVECKEDYNLLYRELRTKRGVPVNIIIVNNGKLNQIRRNYSDEKYRILKNEHGVMGYLDESFDAPDAVLQALLTSSSLHVVLVGNEKTHESLDSRGLLDYLTQREDDSSSKMSACIFSRNGNKAYKYTSIVSRYSGKSSIMVDEISSARILASGTNPEVMERLEIDIQSKNKKLENMEPEKRALKEAADKINTEGQGVHGRIDDLRRAMQSIGKQKTKISSAKGKLKAAEETARMDYGIEKKKEIVDILKRAVKLSLSELENASKCQERMLEATCALAGVRMTQDGFMASARRTLETLEEKKQEFTHLEQRIIQMNARFSDAKRRMKELKAKADRVAPMKDEEGNDLPLKAKLTDLPETLAEVEAAISDTSDIMNNITHNPEALIKYRELKREIATIEDELENIDNAQSAKKAKLENLLTEWKSRLKNTISKVNELFSVYMSNLGCAGEIKLATGNSEGGNSDFSGWGIQILVKFREKSKLQALSAQVQSGGERSVSTIMYLMALQELMVSPFRCVDEINQGLDERNERLVFRRIVQNSTRLAEGKNNNHCGQYFLITPKLLPNLTDMENENVTILFIFNGPFNFNHFSDWSCDKFIGFEETSSENVHGKHSLPENEEDDSDNEGNPIPRKKGSKKKRRIKDE